MDFTREIIIDQPIDKVWDVLGNQFGNAYQWACGLNHSETFGKATLDNAPASNRSCELPTGKIKEVINVFDTNNYVLEYQVIEGFPFFVDTATNNWKLSKINDHQTKVNMHLIVKTKGFVGSVMAPMMKMQLKKQIASIPNDLKYFVETGKPSELKSKELEKKLKKVA